MPKHINHESDLDGLDADDSMIAKPGTVRLEKLTQALPPIIALLLAEKALLFAQALVTESKREGAFDEILAIVRATLQENKP